VGSFQPYPSGLYDLTGSVSEWTSTEDGAEGVVKGASRFDKNPANLRTAVRKIMPIDYSGDDVGFRCVEELDQWRD